MQRLIWTLISIGLGLVACAQGKGQLKPLAPTATAGGFLSSQPQIVSFSELQANPEAYQGRLVRVTGVYYTIPLPDCSPYSGPESKWALISENLRLDAIGFENLLPLAEPETSFTVDGVFRQYEGPVGCGKTAPVAFAWYLEAVKIIQPNPLTRSGAAIAVNVLNLPPGFATPVISPVEATIQPANEASEQSITAVPTATSATTLASTSTNVAPVNVTATQTATLVPSLTSTPSPTITATPTPTASTSTAIPTTTPTNAPAATQPPLATATGGPPSQIQTPPGGYPAFPTSLPPATPDNSYP
jgi:hypothetical protein